MTKPAAYNPKKPVMPPIIVGTITALALLGLLCLLKVSATAHRLTEQMTELRRRMGELEHEVTDVHPVDKVSPPTPTPPPSAARFLPPEVSYDRETRTCYSDAGQPEPCR